MIVFDKYINNAVPFSYGRHLSTLQLFNELLGENVTPEEKKEIDNLYYNSSFYNKPKKKKFKKVRFKKKQESALFAHHRKERLKYIKSKNPANQKYKFSTLHVRANPNNTVVTLRDVNGKVLGWSSCGVNDFDKAKRSSGYAAEYTAQQIGRYTKTHRIKYIQLNIRGVGPGRSPSMKGIRSSGLIVTRLKDTTKISYNGCRSKKLRRV